MSPYCRSYDPFGNINKSAPSNPGPGQITSSYGATYGLNGYSSMTNQVTGGTTAAYDGNGNQTLNTANSLSWNASAQPVNVNGVGATYDPMGRMVETNASGTYTQYVYTPSGNRLATVQSGQLVSANIPLPGGGTAMYKSTGFNYFRHSDWLGSSRLATTWAHSVYSKEAYAPFGETYNEAGTQDRSFTGQDQAASNGINVYDYLFRKYDSVAGRWLSPDPSGWGSVSGSDPQSLNRDAYVENNPMVAVDPNGLDACAYVNDNGSVDIYNGAHGGAVDCPGNGIYIDTPSYVSAIGVDGNGDLSVYGTADGNLFNPNGTMFSVLQQVDVPADGPASFTGWQTFYSSNIQTSYTMLPMDPDEARIRALAQGIAPYARTMNNPKTYACWFGASVAGGLAVYAGAEVIGARSLVQGVNAANAALGEADAAVKPFLTLFNRFVPNSAKSAGAMMLAAVASCYKK